MSEPIRLRSGGIARYEPEPAVALAQAFEDLQTCIDALSADPKNDELHDACDVKLTHAARLTSDPRLNGEMRLGARHQVMETARWLTAMPVGRRRVLGD